MMSRIASDANSPTPRTKLLAHVQVWTREILACVLVLVAIATVVATLYPHADQPLPQWPYKITINGLLSIYTIVLRGCLAYILTSCIGQLQWKWFAAGARPLYDAVLYDNAGRGSWGSLTWLWRYHIQQPLTAMGALLTVVSLAIDPMVQQLVAPAACMWPVPELNATLPRTNYFGFSSSEYRYLPPAANVEFEKAVTIGLSSSGSDILSQCPTGNCTFTDTFGTLGFCASCENISERLLLTYQCCPDTTGSNCTQITDPAGCPRSGIINFVTTLPARPNITSHITNITSVSSRQLTINPGTGKDWRIAGGPINLGRMAWNGDDSGWYSTPGVNMQIVIGNTIFAGTGVNPVTGEQLSECDGTANAQRHWGCRGYGAANCTIWPCVRLYNASVVNTRLTETLVDTVDLPLDSYPVEPGSTKRLDARYIGLINTQCATPDDLSSLAIRNDTILGSESQRWRSFWIAGDLLDPDAARLLPADLLARRCIYVMDSNIAGRLHEELMTKIGEGGANLSAETRGLTSLANHTVPSNPWMSVLGPTPTLVNYYALTGPTLLQKVYNYGDSSTAILGDVLRNMTESLTHFVRAQPMPADYSTPAKGLAFSAETCLSVRWGWLAFPAAVTACVLVFFGTVAAAAARSGLPPWKDSLLAWVFRGPQQQHRWGHQPPPTPDGMESAARGVYVTLVDADVGDPRIVRTKDAASTATAVDGAYGEQVSVARRGDKPQQMASLTEQSLLRGSLDIGSSEVESLSSVSALEDDETAEGVRDCREGGAW